MILNKWHINFFGLLITLLMVIQVGEISGEVSTDVVLHAQIILQKDEFKQDELIGIGVLLKNAGEHPFKLPADLLPEGWLIRLEVRDRRGLIVYASPMVMIEMIAGTRQKQVVVEPNYIYGAELRLKKPVPPGDYLIECVFSTIHLSGWKDSNIPIGIWEASPVKFKVVPK